MVGGLAPSSAGGLTLKGGIPFAIGSWLGGPVAGAALAGGTLGAGAIGRVVANLSTKNQAELARLIILNGGKLPSKIPAVLPPQVKKALGNLILMGGANAPEIGKQLLQLFGPNSQAKGMSDLQPALQ